MMIKRPSLLILILTLVAVTAAAGKVWDDKPWTEWKQREALRVLDESPWTGEQGRGQITLHMQWRSAKPIRLAAARMAQINNPSLTQEQVNQIIDSEVSKDYYVIAISTRAHYGRVESREVGTGASRLQEAGLGIELRNMKQLLETMTIERFKNTTYLVTSGKPKVWAVRYLSPLEVGGEAGLLLFPRHDDQGNPHFDESDKEIRFITSFRDITNFRFSAPFSDINKAFKTKKMIWEGKLEL